MTKTCPSCSTKNRDTARFCIQCAEPLVEKVTCPFCGTESAPQARFCMHCATPLRGAYDAETGLLPPNTLLQNRYTIVDRVGHGGMGAVYEVRDTRITGKRWAVKELSDAALGTSAQKQEAIDAFRREAQMLALLDHPNLPVVSDFFSEGGRHYLVFEFVDGQTLEDMLFDHEGFFDEAEVLDWMGQICDVLTYLHSQNPPVIFRDLKPSNVMIDSRGRAKLIDFGIARHFKAGKTSDTQVMGTPGYAAPEQYGKGQTDSRSDIYSLGVMLHQLLTRYDPGHTPFNLPPPDNINPDISRSVAQVIHRATQTQPLARFQSVEEMRQALSTSSQPAESTPVLSSVRSPVVSPAVDVQPAASRVSPPAVAVSQNRSYWKAVLAHVGAGFGLFYANKRARRKWLYPLLFLFGVFAYLDYNELYLLTDEYVDWEIMRLSFFIAVGVYILSYVDVLLAFQSAARGPANRPAYFSWWKAVGLHLTFGFGLAYADSSVWRKRLYPVVFLVGCFALLDLTALGVFADFFDWEILEVIFYLATLVYGFSFIDLILTGQAVSRGANAIPDDLSLWKALGLQLLFGFGLSYEDSSLGRRWLYPVSYFFSLIAYFDLREFNLIAGLLPEDIYVGLFLVSLMVILFGFVDVCLTYQAITRGSQTVPDDLAWWKAVGWHFCFGAGLAYVDSSVKRKWVYPILFMPILVRLIMYAELDFLFEYPFGHLYYVFFDYIEIGLYLSIVVFALGLADVLLTYRARLKTNP